MMAAPAVAGAAATTSGLAALGSLLGGGMTAGLFITAGSGGLSALLATASVQLLSPAQFEAEVIKLHAESLVCCWENERTRASRIAEDLECLRVEAVRMQREHEHVDSSRGKSDRVRSYAAKVESLGRALDDLEAHSCP